MNNLAEVCLVGLGVGGKKLRKVLCNFISVIHRLSSSMSDTFVPNDSVVRIKNTKGWRIIKIS